MCVAIHKWPVKKFLNIMFSNSGQFSSHTIVVFRSFVFALWINIRMDCSLAHLPRRLANIVNTYVEVQDSKNKAL